MYSLQFRRQKRGNKKNEKNKRKIERNRTVANIWRYDECVRAVNIINANNIHRIYENVFEFFLRQRTEWGEQNDTEANGNGVCARAKKDGTKSKSQEYSLGCCAITYSNPSQFIVQYFTTTNDFRFVMRDDPRQHLQESKSKWVTGRPKERARLKWEVAAVGGRVRV